jgi:hypothetical protein
MGETPPETPPDEPDEPAGWQVLDPDGNVADSGGQTVTEASADAGEET